MKNLTASIQHKLKEIAKNSNQTPQTILFRYFHERLLYRLSKSSYKDNLCLKGGNLIYALEQQSLRPTTDVDFLGQNIDNQNLEKWKQVFTEICNIECEEDAVTFNLDDMVVEHFNEEGRYSGVKLTKVNARFLNANTNQNLTIEIGFGDKVTPDIQTINYPTLLEGMPVPTIIAYPITTLIAEKFQIMIDLAQSNSRMKDFYDVYKLLNGENFDKKDLAQAITNTFRARETPFTENHPLFSDEFSKNEKRVQQWEKFLKDKQLDKIAFEEVLKKIKEYLEPIYNKMNTA